MLPARFRLRDRSLISTTVRQGSRSGRRLLVVHYLPPSAGGDMSDKSFSSTSPRQANSGADSDNGSVGATGTATKEQADTGSARPPRVGFAVSKAVGGSVVRHRVSRKLRHVVAAHTDELPEGCTMVVRALPAAATATSAELEKDFTILMGRVSSCF